MSAVFADTFYFLGLLNRADEAHGQCVRFFHEYRGELVTTEYVIVEIADALSAPAHRVAAARFLDAISRNARVRVIAASSALLARGLDIYAKRPDKEWSLTDCISFVVMADEGISDAATGDHHFAQAGFSPLLVSD